MANTKISAFTDGTTANATDRIAAARSPFGSTDNRYLTPGYIKTYLNALTNTWSVAGAASTPAAYYNGSVLSGGTGTTNFPHVFIEPTGTTATTSWSTSGTTFGINAPAAFVGNFIDIRLGGASRFTLSSTGATTTTNGILAGGNMAVGNSSSLFYWQGTGSYIGTTATNGTWTFSTAGDGTTGFSLAVENTANTMALRNSTNAQTFNVYNTFTNSTNYERLAASWATNVAILDTQKLGTGSTRALSLRVAGTEVLNLGTGATLGIGTAATTTSFSSIAAGTTAKSQINLASSTAPTSPVDGDVWFDGTNLKMRVSGSTKTVTMV